MLKKRACLLFVMLMLSLFNNQAFAHGVMAGTNDFIVGLFHPVTTLEEVLSIFILGMLAGQNGLRRCEFIFWLFPLATMLGEFAALIFVGVPKIHLINIVALVVLGSIVALGKRLPIFALSFLAVLLGLTIGYANGLEAEGQVRPGFFISGVMLAVFFIVGYGTALADFLLHRRITWLPIAIRVAGSWTAAIGLLVLSVNR